MSLLDGDHQRAGLISRVPGLLVALHFFLVLAADAAGDDVGHQHIVQGTIVASELQYDVLSLVQGSHHLVNDAEGGFIHDVFQPPHIPEFAL